MKFEVHNLYARLGEASDEERAFLFHEPPLTYRQGGFVTVRGKRRHVDKVHRLYNPMNRTIPSGMVGAVSKAAERAGLAVELKDSRVRPSLVCAPDLDWLYDYQATAVQRVLDMTRGILWMPTGSGKTEVAVGLSQAVEGRWLFLTHRKGLMGQAADRYELRTGEVAGRIGEGNWSEERFTVATFQSVSRALKARKPEALRLLESVDGIIVDECHVLPASSFWAVVMATKNAYYRVGLSGTPLARDDQRSRLAVAALGSVIYRLRPQELQERGVLAKPTITMTTVEQNSSKPTWQGVYGECIVRSAVRNRVVVDATLRASTPCLLFVKEIKHGRELVARLGKAGLVAEFTWGKHSDDWRKNCIASLERGALDVLVCSVIFQEGTDIPSLASVVIASGGQSAIAALQRIGRGMRSDGGKKKTFEVYDFNDTGHKWLEKHSKARRKAYQAEGFDVSEA